MLDIDLAARLARNRSSEGMEADLWTLEPFACIDNPPNNRNQHRSPVHKAGPIHAGGAEMVSMLKALRVKHTHSRSEPVRLGNIKIGTMSRTNAQAIVPMTILNLPKCQGPGRNLSPTRNTRMKIGIVNATKAATAAIENKAPAAMLPPNINKVMQIPRQALNQTASTGVFVCGLTRDIHQEKGKQPSRAYANVTREAATWASTSFSTETVDDS